MKIQTRLLLAFVILPFLISSLYSQHLELKGKWEGTTQAGEVIKIDFKKNGSAHLFRSQSGIYWGEITGAVFPVNCSLDTTAIPYKFDYGVDGKYSVKGILYFTGKDSVKIYFPSQDENRLTKPDDENLKEIWSLKIIKK
ncbi:MAG TPA: hypothetical protein VHO03_14775 [Ignavibacteriales bacterium]|nr:hypothetical protein [Ignavibacteriales bacterium]